MSGMNPLGRKNLKADAKRKRKDAKLAEGGEFVGEEDVDMPYEV